LARCWRFERRDGVVVTVTTCSIDLLINGEIYRAREGVNPTSLEQQANAAVPNSEITGALSDESVTEVDLEAGKWDGAFVTIFEVNYRDLSMGQMILQTGTIGDVKAGRSAFYAEVRGLSQALQQVVGETSQATCSADFGDARCKVSVVPITVAGAFTAVSDRRTMTDSARAEATDYFGAGLLRITSGDLAGAEMEIADYAAGVFSLVLPFPSNVPVGTTYEAVPGCRKRFQEDCRVKWSNTVNFRGYPHVPGSDKVLGLGGTEGSNL
ncbi:MAG: DUF2163 domain-containing protein, partial [Blastomonas fulva]